MPTPRAARSDLRSFLAALDEAGELRRISAPVSPILEIAEIADRVSKSPAPTRSEHARAFDPEHAHLGGPALLFENVRDCDFPVAINVFGSYRRMEMALGCDGPASEGGGGFESIAARIASLTKPVPPRSLGEILSKAREFAPLLRIPPRSVRRAPCQEVVKLTTRDEVDLTRLPIIKCWPLDGDPAAVGYPLSAEDAGTAAGNGRYITLAGMHTIHADDRDAAKPASHNIGMYRSQLVDRTRLAMHWHVHHDGAAHWRSWKKLGRPMPIAICLGGEAVLPYGATAPLPPGISELLMAGFLNGRGIPMVKAKTVPIRVPANCEIVIEGWVSTEAGPIGFDPRADGDAGELGPCAVFEGPFGDHTGFYSLPDRYPVVEVTAITHRRDAVYPTTIVGLPPQEDYYLGKATERLFLPLLKTIVHDVADYHLPRFGCFHNAASLTVTKAYATQAQRLMHSIWGAGQMAWTKMITVVDDSIDVHDERAVLGAILERCDFRRDLVLARGPLDILDHAAPHLGAGTKIGFDATHPKLPGEESALGSLADPARDDDRAHAEAARTLAALAGHALGDSSGRNATIARVATPEWGRRRLTILAIDSDDSEPAHLDRVEAAIRATWSALDPASSAADLVIAVHADVDVDAFESVFFHFTANADPGRDLLRDDATDGRRIAFDATRKPPGASRDGWPVRDWPPIVAMDDETKHLVDERWSEYGLDG